MIDVQREIDDLCAKLGIVQTKGTGTSIATDDTPYRTFVSQVALPPHDLEPVEFAGLIKSLVSMFVAGVEEQLSPPGAVRVIEWRSRPVMSFEMHTKTLLGETKAEDLEVPDKLWIRIRARVAFLQKSPAVGGVKAEGQPLSAVG